MRLIKATVLAQMLGISRRTVSQWCRRDPNLAITKPGRFPTHRDYYIRVSELAKKPGMDIIEALTLGSQKWIKAVDLARMAGVPRRTLANWCKTRPWFARRIGNIWYINPEVLGATEDQADFLRKWAPQAKTAARVAERASKLGKFLTEEGSDDEERTGEAGR